jgi:VCBS repeat-containing protein
MSDQNLLTRREFTLESALAILSAATITITGCGDGDNGQGPSPQPGGGEVGTISANHGHTATISAAQITGGGAIVSLDIRGSATHPHTIDLTAAQVVSIGQNQQVSVVSTTNDAHSHTVTFN